MLVNEACFFEGVQQRSFKASFFFLNNEPSV
uniref:Uncharacterized protein n=1 Tax=Anguilla anguilla TaxID=7936 RepID=A0A0E9RPP7_ANGAN